ncbi:MAG: zinc-ribbon domain containing protein [Dehalococcoidia bacterium]|nr:zinc-ribbon domain containing protein [Dehalococcoidia bacterium]
MVSFLDKTLICRDCGSSFVFTAGEQEFFSQKGFVNEPSRCPDCRAQRRGGFSPGGGGGGRSSGGAREMHPATCARCGAQTQVPFLPRGDRPVYCDACYKRERER